MNTTSISRFQLPSLGLLTVLLALLLLIPAGKGFAQTTTKAKPKWYAYSTEVGKIKAKFPGNPALENQDTEIGKKHTATARFGENTYMISYVIHSTTLAEQEKLADASLTAFRDKVKGQILNQSSWSVKKAGNGIRATIAMPDKDAKVEYRVILIGQIQYQVIVVAPTDKYDSKVADKFFKKVKIKA
jgi:hypothetical protein